MTTPYWLGKGITKPVTPFFYRDFLPLSESGTLTALLDDEYALHPSGAPA